MERKRKEILFPILVVLCAAILFFALGYIAASYFGTPYVFQAKTADNTELTTGTLSLIEDTNQADLQTPDHSTTANGISDQPDPSNSIATSTIPSSTTSQSVIPTTSKTTAKTEPPTTNRTSATTSAPIISKINLNTASKEELMAVPGIGPKIAEAIIQYREDFGPFTELSQLQEVKGIGEKRYNDWVEYFTID